MRSVFRSALAVTLCLTSSAVAAPLAPSKPSEIRTVLGQTTPCPGLPVLRAVDSQQLPNGTAIPFTIPPGKVFVVTGFDYAVVGNPGAVINVALMVSDGIAGSSFAATCGMTLGSNGFGAGSCAISTGALVKSGFNLCFSPPGANVIAHGFLTKDK